MIESCYYPVTVDEAKQHFENSTDEITNSLTECIRNYACPHCGSDPGSAYEVIWIKGRRTVWCSACKKQYSERSGTIFAESPLPLSAWYFAIWFYLNVPEGYVGGGVELAHQLDVTQFCAWKMRQQLSQALKLQEYREWVHKWFVSDLSANVRGEPQNLKKVRACK